MEKAGVDHTALLETYIHAINICTQGRPDDLTIGVHMCRGNYKVSSITTRWPTTHSLFQGGVYFSEGGYARIAAKLFSTLDVDTFYVRAFFSHHITCWFVDRQLEYDTERAGDFMPLKYLPLNKVVVLGLVTTKNARVNPILLFSYV